MATQEPKQFKKITKVVSLSVFGIIGVLAIGYFGVVRPLQVRAEKKEFLAAEQDLTQLKSDLIAKLGTPEKEEQQSSCGYSSAKLEGRKLWCGVTFSIVYPITSRAQANEKYHSLRDALQNSTAKISSANESDFNPINHAYNAQTRTIELEVVGGLRCVVYAQYGNAGGEISLENSSAPQAFEVSGLCNGQALSKHFPLRK